MTRKISTDSEKATRLAFLILIFFAILLSLYPSELEIIKEYKFFMMITLFISGGVLSIVGLYHGIRAFKVGKNIKLVISTVFHMVVFLFFLLFLVQNILLH